MVLLALIDPAGRDIEGAECLFPDVPKDNSCLFCVH